MAYHPRAHDRRGNNRDRKARRDWLYARHRVPGGYVLCRWCGRRMRTRWQVDRWPVCGHKGGSYTRDNVVISCPKCNEGRCKGGVCA